MYQTRNGILFFEGPIKVKITHFACVCVCVCVCARVFYWSHGVWITCLFTTKIVLRHGDDAYTTASPCFFCITCSLVHAPMWCYRMPKLEVRNFCREKSAASGQDLIKWLSSHWWRSCLTLLYPIIRTLYTLRVGSLRVRWVPSWGLDPGASQACGRSVLHTFASKPKPLKCTWCAPLRIWNSFTVVSLVFSQWLLVCFLIFMPFWGNFSLFFFCYWQRQRRPPIICGWLTRLNVVNSNVLIYIRGDLQAPDMTGCNSSFKTSEY